jgi:hypothetical protein
MLMGAYDYMVDADGATDLPTECAKKKSRSCRQEQSDNKQRPFRRRPYHYLFLLLIVMYRRLFVVVVS